LENRICETGPNASVADSVSVAFRLLVDAAPPLITTVPDGGWLSTMTEIVLVALLAAASVARAPSVCGPSATPDVLHEREYGDDVSRVPMLVAPSSRNWTPVTPTSSLAVAVRPTEVPRT
jgi:hypothetical protein